MKTVVYSTIAAFCTLLSFSLVSHAQTDEVLDEPTLETQGAKPAAPSAQSTEPPAETVKKGLGEPCATITALKGQADIAVINLNQLSDRGARVTKLQGRIYEGDKLITLDNQTVTIEFDDKTELVVGPSSAFKVDRFDGRAAQQSSFTLFYGKLKFWVRKLYDNDESFIVHTPSAVIGLKGAKNEFFVESDRVTRETRIFSLKGQLTSAKDATTLQRFLKEGSWASRVSPVSAGLTTQLRPSSTAVPKAQPFELAVLRGRLQKEAPDFEKLLDAEAYAKEQAAKSAKVNPSPAKQTNAQKRLKDAVDESRASGGPTIQQGTDPLRKKRVEQLIHR